MSEWHWPQWAVAAQMALEVVTHVSKHGEPRGAYDGPGAAVGAAIVAVVLWFGGFWG